MNIIQLQLIENQSWCKWIECCKLRDISIQTNHQYFINRISDDKARKTGQEQRNIITHCWQLIWTESKNHITQSVPKLTRKSVICAWRSSLCQWVEHLTRAGSGPEKLIKSLAIIPMEPVRSVTFINWAGQVLKVCCFFGGLSSLNWPKNFYEFRNKAWSKVAILIYVIWISLIIERWLCCVVRKQITSAKTLSLIRL